MDEILILYRSARLFGFRCVLKNEDTIVGLNGRIERSDFAPPGRLVCVSIERSVFGLRPTEHRVVFDPRDQAEVAAALVNIGVAEVPDG